MPFDLGTSGTSDEGDSRTARGEECTTSGDEHVLAEICVEPATSGEEHNHAVRQAIQALSGLDLVVTVGAMSTAVEGPLDDVLAAVARAHRSADTRSNRVITTVRIESKDGGLHLRDRESELNRASALLRP